MIFPTIRTDILSDVPYGLKCASCAVYIGARKHGQSTFGTLKRSIGGLVQMGHRREMQIREG